MNGCDDRCIVCGEVSAALICRECRVLIGARPLRPEMTPPSPRPAAVAERE